LRIGGDSIFINIGERTNVAGSKRFARLIAEKKYEEALTVARQQADAGAHILDVNMDDSLLDARAEMVHFLNMLSTEPEIARLPIMIDSSRWEVAEAGLKCLQGKSVVNSISLKEGEDTFLERAGLIRRLGAAAVVMAFDEQGQATSFQRRIEICKRAYDLLTKKTGFPAEDIYFDPNILTIGTGMDEHNNFALDYIRSVAWIKENLPGVRTSGGISNLSFAFRGNNPVREAIHTVFLYHAVKAGLDMGIVNAGELPIYDDLDPDLRKLAEDLVLNRRKDATERLIMFAAQMKEVGEATKSAEAWRDEEVESRLRIALVRGITDYLEADLAEALRRYPTAMDIIAGPLMNAMNYIGDLFGAGQMFLPQVVKSARVMKKAVNELMPHIEAEQKGHGDEHYKATILMATVKGDVHDIGKNIVSLIMACNSFRVIDLGVMVPSNVIIKNAIEQKVDAIGLSGLIAPSLDEMIVVAREMEAAGLKIPLLIGGATTSEKHTSLRIAPEYSGPVVHVRDAGRSVGVLNELFGADHSKATGAIRQKQETLRTKFADEAARDHSLIEEARKNALQIEWPHYEFTIPKREGIFRIEELPVAELIPFIDWTFFFNAWQISGRFPELLEDPVKGKEAASLLQDAKAMLEKIVAEKWIKPKGFFGIFPANRSGDDVKVFSDDTRQQHLGSLHFMRNQDAPTQGAPNLCLSDFIAPEGYPDHIGLFAVTAGIGVKEIAASFVQQGDDYRSFMLLLLADRLAEAFAEYLHWKVRSEFWGYSAEDSPDIPALLKGQFIGIRPAPGYPACPDHSEKATIFKLLNISVNEGLALTESHMMDPVASVCGYYFTHPLSRYFNLGQVQEDQKRDYIERKRQA
jgi:5-methyltetrahydrofolate--homocysteine methyltransferase